MPSPSTTMGAEDVKEVARRFPLKFRQNGVDKGVGARGDAQGGRRAHGPGAAQSSTGDRVPEQREVGGRGEPLRPARQIASASSSKAAARRRLAGTFVVSW